QAETPDEYGRREDCFRNSRQHPFTFQSYLTDLQSTKEATERDGLVSQPGLKAGVLPNPQIAEEVLDQDQHHRLNAENLLRNSPPAYFLPSASSHIKELFIPVEDLDLGSCPKHDLQDYICPVLAKRYDNPFEQWLPLASTRTDRDESLGFPPVLNRLWAQICREIETDKPITSDAAAELVRKIDKPITAFQYQDLIKRQTKFGPSQYSCVEPISPPLSPISDDAAPFIPDGNVTVIDLVSEPNSPDRTTIEDSEPIVSYTFMTPSPTRELPQLFETHNAVIEEAKVDLPVVFTSSYSPRQENILADICLPLIGFEEDATDLLQERGHFEDAFMTLLDDRRYYANKLVSQERLDPADSISRIPVPLLDFGIQPPTWRAQCSTAETHFEFLKNRMPSIFNLLPSPRDLELEVNVSYSVVPPDQGRSIMTYEHGVSNEAAIKYLSQDLTSHQSSLDFITIRPELEVLCIIGDEELEEVYEPEEAYVPADMTDDMPPVIVAEQHEDTNRMNSPQRSESFYYKKRNSPGPSRSLRRKADDSMRLLPKCYDTSATSILLHNFMELRGIKRPRLDTRSSEACQTAGNLSLESVNDVYSTDMAKELPTTIPEAMVSAVFPKFEIPSVMAYFIVSVDLPRPILRQLERAWSPESLLDIDYSEHIAISRPSESAQCKETTSELGFEADVSLSPITGIIVTNILKVRQRPLPGSQSQSPLRDRVQKVSRKYETLLVLVSESHPSGEFSGALAPSDIAAYADFVSFTVALDGDINVQLVPGAEQTMASWISACLSRSSFKSHGMKRLLSSEETEWEIFLRRAGVNVFAAKILSKTLFEQAGASGLAEFLTMPVQKRVATFSPLLGGEKVLRLTAKALDRSW
ncbi:hypothetical protein TRIATDRAFT_162407, partial [Trichoderma atroviride IMI 206040]